MSRLFSVSASRPVITFQFDMSVEVYLAKTHELLVKVYRLATHVSYEATQKAMEPFFNSFLKYRQHTYVEKFRIR